MNIREILAQEVTVLANITPSWDVLAPIEVSPPILHVLEAMDVLVNHTDSTHISYLAFAKTWAKRAISSLELPIFFEDEGVKEVEENLVLASVHRVANAISTLESFPEEIGDVAKAYEARLSQLHAMALSL